MRTSNYFKVFIVFLLLNQVLMGAAGDPVRGKGGMVVSASDLASQVGLLILKRGGNAVDAAVATGFALAVTYPEAGNLGGGGYMVIHLSGGRDIALDYRERAPYKAFRDMFLDESGNFDLKKSTEGFTSAGVPGSVAGLIYALEKYGTMKLEEVIQPAIEIARDGFPMSYRLAESINGKLTEFRRYKSSEKVYTKNGLPYKEGDIFKQPDLAATLQLIKEKGRDGFYKGKTAELILKQSAEMGGIFSREDLEDYKVIEKVPLKGTYRGHEIISMPPSSSGGTALIQTLNIMENVNLQHEDWNGSSYIHQLTEALKYVYADRSKYLGDADFVKVPVEWLISKEYARSIFSRIGSTALASSQVGPGVPARPESEQTTHYSIADKYGNAVSTTTTLNSSFGNKIIVDGAGFLLNNEMDDFSSKPGFPNQFGLTGSEANSITPGKRMLSSMTPTIVLKNGKPYIIIGTPGGSTIITVVLQVIMNCVDFGMNISEAVAAPKIHHQWLPDELYYEEYGMAKDVKNNLQSMGHLLGGKRDLGRAEGIMIDQASGVFYGATDPRGYGQAAGF